MISWKFVPFILICIHINRLAIEATGIEGENLSKLFSKSKNFFIKDGAIYEVDDSEVSILESPVSDNEQSIWELINNFDSYKTSVMYESVNGKKTLKKMKYLCLLIWWSDEDVNDPELTIDQNHVQSIFNQNRQYFKDMSWNKIDVTFEIVPQRKFPISKAAPDLGELADAAKEIILNDLGYIKDVDYNGVALIYNGADGGSLAGNGGWGSVNGSFIWMGNQIRLGTTRHEIGHNFGHPHHVSNAYRYREVRPKKGDLVVPYDGWDMMSGGNNYDISHFAAASKWFYNWIPDSSVIHMQLQGSTASCPHCVGEGTYTLTTFDNKNLPPSADRKMAIHIPFAMESSKLYSYWFSYRGTGNNGLASKGLSVHLTWFHLHGYFGATYDSLNYDTFGDTETTDDSFVELDSCYHLAPTAFTKDRELWALDNLQPILCVTALDVGNTITVSVSFLDKANIPSPQIEFEETSLECSVNGVSKNLQLAADKYHLIHVHDIGYDGTVSFEMCTNAYRAKGFFYDEYPHSLINFHSEPAYGAYLGLEVDTFYCCSPGSFIASPGAKVVVVTQNIDTAMHLNEIEIYDADGINLALNSTCFAKSTALMNGNPNCLNDGLAGSGTCTSHSKTYVSGNFDYCVLESPVDIAMIRIFPRADKPRYTDRLKDLTLTIYSDVAGESEDAVFHGELASYRLQNVFTSTKLDPYEQDVSLDLNIPCPNTEDQTPKSMEYDSVFGNAYIVVPPSGDSNSFSEITVSCSFTQCLQNYFLSYDVCSQCPSESLSSIGSVECENCPGGSERLYEFASSCEISESYEFIPSSKGWRIWTDDSHAELWYAWSVAEIEFYDSSDCSGSKIPNSGTPFDSGNAGSSFQAEQAFGGSGKWGGRVDDDRYLYVGQMFKSDIEVGCVKIYNPGTTGRSISEVRIQAYNEEKGTWENAFIYKNFDMAANAVNVISIHPNSNIPSSLPSRSSLVILTDSPSLRQSNTPSMQPSKSPILLSKDSSKPSVGPSLGYAGPSHLNSIHPTCYNDWTLNFTNYTFETANNELEMDILTVNYLVAKGKSQDQFTGRLYTENCVELINDFALSIVDKEIKPSRKPYDDGSIKIDLDKNSIGDSLLWESISDDSGMLSFCVKSELMQDDDQSISVSYVKTNVKIMYNFLVGFATFEISDVKIKEYQTAEVIEQGALDVSACVCHLTPDDTHVCADNDILSQNSKLKVCVFPSNGMQVQRFESITMYQENILVFMPIENGIPSPITKTSSGMVGVMTTIMISKFFEKVIAPPVTIRGEVLLGVTKGRKLHDNSKNKAKFEVKVSLCQSFWGRMGKNSYYMLSLLGIIILFATRVKKEISNYSILENDEI